jgi:tetratricopeptide (TPR) repeat protein
MKKLIIIGALTVFAACKEDPAETHHRVAVDLYAKGDFAKAAAEYEEVIKLNPSLDEKVQKKAAQAWMKAGEQEKAVAILERLANGKTGADKLEGYREIAGLYMSNSNYEKAEQWFMKILEQAPKDADTLNWLAELASIRGGARNTSALVKPDQLDLALKRYDEAIAANPTDPKPWVNKRIVYIRYIDYEQKQKAQALTDAETNKADKDSAADFKKEAEKRQAHSEELKAQMDEATKKLGEIMKAAKAAAAAAPATPAKP